MKITKRQLKRMIAEAMTAGGVPDVVGATTGVPGGNIQNLVDEYKEWATDYMGAPSGANSSSVLATFLVDRGLDQGPVADDIIADMSSAMKFDQYDVDNDVTRARREHDAGRTLPEANMRISKRQLRRLIKEQMDGPGMDSPDPMATINQVLADSLPGVKQAGQDSYAKLHKTTDAYQDYDYKPGSKSDVIEYQFMSAYGAHDDHLWNISTTKTRQVVLEALLNAGAFIPGPVPVMDDFGTPGVNFALDGQKFILSTTGFRYTVRIYAIREK